MKNKLSVFKIIAMAVLPALAVCTASAQLMPPTNTNTYSGGGSTNTVDWAAIEAAEQAQFAANYLPWIQQDDTFLHLNQGYGTFSINAIGIPIFTGDDAESIRIANLNALSVGFQAENTAFMRP